jgi:hypothetical protein
MRAVRVLGEGPAGVMAALAAMREGAPSTGRRGGRPFPNRCGIGSEYCEHSESPDGRRAICRVLDGNLSGLSGFLGVESSGEFRARKKYRGPTGTNRRRRIGWRPFLDSRMAVQADYRP